MLDVTWVGRKVVARRTVEPAGAGRPRFADVVGDLLALDGGVARIESRAGIVEIAVADLAAARLVEPATADILALERICALGWRPAETAQLGGWTLRADAGFTGRANSVLPAGQLDRPLAEAVAAARAWYAARGLPLRVQVPLPARRLLDAGLAELGFTADADVHVLASRLDRLPPGAVEVAAEPDVEWLTAYHYRGGTLPATAPALLARHERAGFAAVRRDGRIVATARGAVDGEWLGVTAVEVDPAWRRHGLATALLTGLASWATARHGARWAYLQVESTNGPALALYERLGFWRHHDYRYRVEPLR